MCKSGLVVILGVCVAVGCGKDEANSSKAAPPTTPKHSASKTKAPAAKSVETPAQALLERATKLAHKYIIVDGHVDLPYRLAALKLKHGKINVDISKRTEKGDFDYPRARAGGLNAAFMSIYIPAKHQKSGGAKALADSLIDMVEGFVTKYPDKFAIAKSPADVEAQFAKKLVSLPMGIENGAAIERDLKNLAHFHKRGIRYITLTHSKNNAIGDSSYDTKPRWKGLSPFGKKLVAEMNRLGIMVDISHVSDATFYQVLEVTKVPIIASHSSLRHFVPKFERNMSDDMVVKLAKNGGVVMINFGSGFVTKKANDDYASFRAAHAKLAAEIKKAKLKPAAAAKRRAAFIADYKKQHKQHFATVGQVADHITRVVKLVGINHVGLGSDFDGVGDSLPVGLKDASQYPNLIAELLKRKFSDDDIRKLAGANLLRVWRQVEAYAAKQAKVKPKPRRRVGMSGILIDIRPPARERGSKNLTLRIVRRTIMRRYIRGLRKCHKRLLRVDPLAGGRVWLTFTVGKRGRVIRSKAKGFSATVDACIRRRMLRWRFAPKPRDFDDEPTSARYRLRIRLKAK